MALGLWPPGNCSRWLAASDHAARTLQSYPSHGAPPTKNYKKCLPFLVSLMIAFIAIEVITTALFGFNHFLCTFLSLCEQNDINRAFCMYLGLLPIQWSASSCCVAPFGGALSGCFLLRSSYKALQRRQPVCIGPCV